MPGLYKMLVSPAMRPLPWRFSTPIPPSVPSGGEGLVLTKWEFEALGCEPSGERRTSQLVERRKAQLPEFCRSLARSPISQKTRWLPSSA